MGKFSFTHEEKSVDRGSKVTVTQIDPELVAALEAEWTDILAGIESGKPAYDLVLVMDSPKTVAITAAHARAWGVSRGNGNNDVRRVEVRKLPPRTKGLTADQAKREGNTLRLSLTKYDPNAPKLGRKAKGNGANTDTANTGTASK